MLLQFHNLNMLQSQISLKWENKAINALKQVSKNIDFQESVGFEQVSKQLKS